MTEFDTKMQQLRAEYRTAAAADLQALRQQAASLRGDEDDRGTLQSMVEALHRMAGGAGVFGFASLSEQAHGLELDLEDWLTAPLTNAYRAALPDLCDALRSLALPGE